MHINTLKDVRDALVLADRSGAEKDEPEGTRYIQLSDTITNQMIATIDEITAIVEMAQNSKKEDDHGQA